ncbi:MAG: hypothetical protein ACJASN_001719 [Cyclobacteriaceae bacterium]
MNDIKITTEYITISRLSVKLIDFFSSLNKLKIQS